jgi:hypothetical protein
VLVIALLATLLASHRLAGQATAPTHPPLTLTATQDPTSQAYVDLLRVYYVPLAQAYTPALTCVLNALALQTISDMVACRAPVQTEQAAAQALSAHLANATPPARWQMQHAALRAATQGLITWSTQELQAIEARSLALFAANYSSSIDVGAAFCDPINHINAGPPRVSPPLTMVQQFTNTGGVTCV